MLIFIPTTALTIVYSFIGLSQPPVPSILLFCLLALPILLAFQLGIILKASKKEFGTYCLNSAFSNYNKMGKWKIFLYGIILLAFAGVMTIVITPLENSLLSPISKVISQSTPEYFNWNSIEYIKQYPKNTIVLTCIVYFLFNVLIAPIVEELFFRGYLTSRISRFGNFAPLIITVLFSLYHFWLPFNNLFRIFAFFPAAFVAWKKKNIYIAIIFHCLCNLFSTISFIIAVCS